MPDVSTSTCMTCFPGHREDAWVSGSPAAPPISGSGQAQTDTARQTLLSGAGPGRQRSADSQTLPACKGGPGPWPAASPVRSS